MGLIRRILVILVVGFFVYYLVVQPESAAAAVRGVAAAVGRAFVSIMTFFSSLAG